MSMQPDAATPGLWVNTEWEQGMAGTFAVVIGISRYAYLQGGAESYMLGQLYVSATTAYRFFRWLCDDYIYTTSPLAKCWLLLSPTGAEIAAERSLKEHLLEPTFQNCNRAGVQQQACCFKDRNTSNGCLHGLMNAGNIIATVPNESWLADISNVISLFP